MRTYIKKFESYLSGKTCFLIDESEFLELKKEKVVDSDKSGKTDFRKKEKEYSVPLKTLQKEFEKSCGGIFGRDKLFYSKIHQDLLYGNKRFLVLEYRSIQTTSWEGDVRCDIWEIKDYWFLGYFTYYNSYGYGHVYFKCDQIEGVRDLSKMKSEIFEVIELGTDGYLEAEIEDDIIGG